MTARPPARAAALALAALMSCPAQAYAQRQVFVEGLARLTAALPDARPHGAVEIEAALDAMDRGLAAWDREIRELESRAAAARGAGPAPALRLALAGQYLERSRLEDALREIDEAIRADPRQADLHRLRGLVLDASGRARDAAGAFREAWSLDPGDPVRAYLAAASEARDDTGRDLEGARAVLQRVFEEALTRDARPSSPPFWRIALVPDSAARAPVLPYDACASAYDLLARGRYREAIDAFRAASARGSSGALEEERERTAGARSLLDQARHAEAEVALLSLVRDFPRSGVARWLLGSLYDRLGLAAEARRAYEAAAASHPLAGRGALEAAIGRLAHAEGDFARALRAFENHVRLDPGNGAARRQLARVYLDHGRVADARAELAAALLIDPRDAAAHAAAGQLLVDEGRHDAAVRALHRALALDASLHDARYALGTALSRLGRADEARRELERFEQARRQGLDARRREIAEQVRREEAALLAAESAR